ncbi:hypothetical protein AJ80_06460 [Polytolypa hystricis UAMH7299]|uniref:Zinc/iron permease n=1 Tax=Polytolypa hystricis (strain UAMH7299) TaxID=1447883 RepID=A0A2B7XWZ2_POLH7|nr:hypothetical protein AJ80_06460 [Polytolypa hystricis UAMH7299]
MGFDIDTRGWIMSCIGGIACMMGASIICVDLLTARCFGKKGFRITESNVFLSSSLSLSAGVLLYTSLYSMLPTSKNYLTKAGFSASAASFILIGLFLSGVVIIQFLSTFIHRYIPSHIVNCEHTHEPERKAAPAGEAVVEQLGSVQTMPPPPHRPGLGVTEESPLLSHSSSNNSVPPELQVEVLPESPKIPPLGKRLSKQFRSLVTGTKPFCDEDGPCYGLSQACGQECIKTLTHNNRRIAPIFRQHSIAGQLHSSIDSELDVEAGDVRAEIRGVPRAADRHSHAHEANGSLQHSHLIPPAHPAATFTPASDADHHEAQQHVHHHHVPKNAFMSIGLQTSLAISLHKIPEGFITFATNHTNPSLGFSVFTALFLHNITEGFAMALPLYLALNSRAKAMFWSSLLGGISQPVGAGIAALWIWGAGKARGHPTDGDAEVDGPSWAVYGGMFAATAGVMTIVALQLFSEGLGLSHNRNLCVAFAIIGMGILGFSSALTA